MYLCPKKARSEIPNGPNMTSTMNAGSGMPMIFMLEGSAAEDMAGEGSGGD